MPYISSGFSSNTLLLIPFSSNPTQNYLKTVNTCLPGTTWAVMLSQGSLTTTSNEDTFFLNLLNRSLPYF